MDRKSLSHFVLLCLIMLPLRLCYLILPCLFDEKCVRSNPPQKDLTDTILSGFNVSLVRKPSSLHSSTNDEDKEIDECLLSVERNESDAILFPNTMPVIMNNIKTGPVVFSDKIGIASTYKFESVSSPEVFATFDAFGIDALTLILNFLVIMAVLICLTYILERKSPRCLVRINGRRFKLRFVSWFIFRFFVKQYPLFPGNITALKALLTCCLLLFSYYVTFFYTSMIKTDMVTVKTPRVIASYQDILDDPQIEPYIWRAFDEYKSFKVARAGSRKKNIWKRILKMGVNKLVVADLRSNFLDPNHPFMRSKAVGMAYANVYNAGKQFFALYLKKEKTRGLYVSDPTESEKVSASVINRMTTETVSYKYQARMRRFFEGHFYQVFIKNLGLEQVQFYADSFEMGKDISDVEQYFSQRVVLPEPVIVKPNITYFMPLFISYLALCFIQSIVFLVKRWISHKD